MVSSKPLTGSRGEIIPGVKFFMAHQISHIGVSYPKIEKAGQDGFVLLAPSFIFVSYLTNNYQEMAAC